MVVCQTKSQPSRLLSKPQQPLSLRLLSGDQQGKVYCLKEAKCLLGSDSSCAVPVVAEGVRPVHCLIVQGAHQTIVRRWATDAWLNGKAFESALLESGDHLQIGSMEFEVLQELEELTDIANQAPVTGKRNFLELSMLQKEFQEPFLQESKLDTKIQSLQSIIEESNSRIAFLSKEETAAKVESLAYQARIQELQELLAKQDVLLKTKQAKWQQALENETTRFHEEKHAYESDLSERQTSILKLKEECREHQNSLARLQALQHAQQEEVADLRNALHRAEAELQQHRESSDASTASWEEKQAAWTEVRKRLEAERVAMQEQHELAAATWEAANADAQEKHNALKLEVSQIEEELVTVSLQLTEKTNSVHQKASEIAKIETALENTRNELQESKNRLETAKADWAAQEATWTKVRERLEEERTTQKNQYEEESESWGKKEAEFKQEISDLERNVKHVEEELVAICNQLTHAVEDGRKQAKQKEAFENELKEVTRKLEANQSLFEAAQEEWEEKQVAWTEVRKRWEAERAELLEQHANEIQAWKEKEIAAEKNASLQQETVSWLEDEISRVKKALENSEKATLQETAKIVTLKTSLSQTEESLCRAQQALKKARADAEVKELQWTEVRQKWEAERTAIMLEHETSLNHIEEQLALQQHLVEEKSTLISSLQEELRNVQEDAAHSELSLVEQVEQFSRLQENFSRNELELQNMRESWLQVQADTETKAIEWQQKLSAKEGEFALLQDELNNRQSSFEQETQELRDQLRELVEEKARLCSSLTELEEQCRRLEETVNQNAIALSDSKIEAKEKLSAIEESHALALAEAQEKLQAVQEKLNQTGIEQEQARNALQQRFEEEKAALEAERASLRASLEEALSERDAAIREQVEPVLADAEDKARSENEEAYAILSKELEEREQQLADRESMLAEEQHAFQEMVEQHAELTENVTLEAEQEELVEDRLDSMVEQLKNRQPDVSCFSPPEEKEKKVDDSETEAAIEHLKALNIWDDSVQEESQEHRDDVIGRGAKPEPQKSWLPDSLEEESAAVLDASQEISSSVDETTNEETPFEPIETVNEIHETPENGETEDEAALAEYMSKLMQRVRGEPELASPAAVAPTVQIEPTSVEEPNNEATGTLTTVDQSDAANAEPESQITEGVVPFGWDKSKPKLSLPERQGNYESLRNLANSSARTALGTHAKTMSYKLFFSKVFVSAVGLIAGGLLLFLSDTWVSIEASAGFASLAVGGIWALQSCGLLLEAIRRGSFSESEAAQTQTNTDSASGTAESTAS